MRPTRRNVLRSVAAGGITLGLAGCTEGGPEGTETEGPGGSATDEPVGTETETEMGTGTEAGTGTETGTGTGTETGTGTGTETGTDTAASVQLREFDGVGQAMVGPEGMTLYMFDNDEQGSGASSCSGGCLENWPALTVESESDLSASSDVTAELTTFEREDDGAMQVAANGWPLYYWAKDEEPGDMTGQGVGDVWWMLDPAGEPIRSGTETGTETSS